MAKTVNVCWPHRVTDFDFIDWLTCPVFPVHGDWMNRNKVVEMYCPNCKDIVGSQPVIMVLADGSSRLEEHRLKRCPFCHSGLQRHVTRV
jgi:hypothetical protein